MSVPIELKKRVFGNRQEGPHLLIAGGVHGDEFEPMAAIRQLIEDFEAGESPADTLRGKVTLVPVVNEDAFIRGQRCAEDGLDLARTCPGKPGGSITERTAHALSEMIREADYFIDLHTGGTELSVFPLAGYMLVENEAVLEIQRRMAKAFNLPVAWGTSGKLDGRSLSVARDAGIPAIYAEHHGSGVCRGAGVTDYITGCWSVMNELGMVDFQRPHDRNRYFIEDARPGAGHLQIRHPSPVDGFFEAAVELGDDVEAGESLGEVSDIVGKEHHTILAEESGIVIVLRTFPRVRQGESVGVVMNLEPGQPA